MSSLVSGAYRLFSKDRNILIPLDNISKAKLITDEQLKKQFCEKDKELKEISDTIAKLKKVKDAEPKKILSNLEKVLNRF